MIKINYSPDKRILRMKGHAEYDIKGKDIVCASASMLFYTLAQTLRLFEHEGMLAKSPMLRMSSGTARLEFVPKSGYEANADLAAMTVLTGFKLLAEQYPDCVDLVITEK